MFVKRQAFSTYFDKKGVSALEHVEIGELIMTEEKVKKLLPIVESILSRKMGKKLILKDLSYGGVTVYRDDCAK